MDISGDSLAVESPSHSRGVPSTPSVPVGMKASFLHWPKKAPHKYKQLGVVVVHDPNTEISVHEFDFRYRGKRSRLGRYLRDLQAKGVDISALVKKPTPREDEELTLHIAKRLYEALVKRTIFERQGQKPGLSTTYPVIVTKKYEAWDWSKPAARQSKYYKMAEKILAENDHETALRIVNLITGYA